MYGVRICSFHDADGDGVDYNGRTWRWEFSRLFGPLFVDQRGSPLRVQPGERSPAWKVFERWYEKWRADPTSDSP